METGHNIRVLVSDDNERTISSLRVGDAMLEELGIGPQVDIVNKPILRDLRIAMSSDGESVILGSQGNFSLWNLNTGSVREQDLGDFHVTSIGFDAKNKRVVFGSLFGPLVVWDLERELLVLEGHISRVIDVVVSQDGSSVISASRDDTIRIWDLDSAKQMSQLAGHFGKVDAVAIAPDGHIAYSIYSDTLIAYDLDVIKRIASLSFDHQISTIAVTPAGKRIAVGDQSGQVHFLCLQI
jgi:WD40 repeat protein